MIAPAVTITVRPSLVIGTSRVLFDFPISGEGPFTMTGQLVVGNQTQNTAGSGTVHVVDAGIQSNARYVFSVPEPSSALLLFTGVSALLVARRRRPSARLRDRA